MVAGINTIMSKKVKTEKQNIYIYASGFIKDNNEPNFYDKLSHFESYVSLNKRAYSTTQQGNCADSKERDLDGRCAY
jgi:hypothetical protein